MKTRIGEVSGWLAPNYFRIDFFHRFIQFHASGRFFVYVVIWILDYHHSTFDTVIRRVSLREIYAP